jgi:hypothetical protein
MFSRMLCSAATILPAGKEPGLAVVESALGGLPLRPRQTLALGELPVPFYPRIVEPAPIPVGRLTSRLTLAGRPSEGAWRKSQERRTTDELC